MTFKLPKKREFLRRCSFWLETMRRGEEKSFGGIFDDFGLVVDEMTHLIVLKYKYISVQMHKVCSNNIGM